MSPAPAPMQSKNPVSVPFNQAQSQVAGIHPFLHWWYHFSGPADVSERPSFAERELVRRSRIASLIILGVLGSAVLLVPIILLAAPATFFVIPQVITTTLIGMSCCIGALMLNRWKYLHITALLLMIGVDIIVAGIVLSERNGLNPLILSLYDLLVVTELIAASLLPAVSVFLVAMLNMILLVLDVNAQPHSMMWTQMIQSQQLVYSLLARPAVLYLVVAAVAFLWVQSAFTALKRADRAEEIAELERQELERKRELEQVIEQIVLVQARVANGDYDARVPLYEHHVLWQVSMAFNTLLSRFKAASLSERTLRRVIEELAQLHVALRSWHRDQPLHWYPTDKNLLSPLADDLRMLLLQTRTQDMRNAANAQRIPGTPIPPAVYEARRVRNPVTDASGLASNISFQAPGRNSTHSVPFSDEERSPYQGWEEV